MLLSCALALLCSLVITLCRADEVLPINVHFVPHSHLDAGWLETYDEYYATEAFSIFNSVVHKMRYDRDVTYTVGDLAFFQRYYSNLPNFEQKQVSSLVKSGQLEIIHGGLVSTDEACPNYSDVLRNFE